VPVDIEFLDAPVSGGDVGARDGTLSIMVGGDEAQVAQADDVFKCLGTTIIHTGPVGNGQMTKCINQIAVGINVSAMTEALVLAKGAGLDLETTLKVISAGAAGSWCLDNYAPRILQGDLRPGFFAKHMLKDLRIALAEADSLETTLPISHLVKELYLALCAGGDAELGNHGLIRLYERIAGKG